MPSVAIHHAPDTTPATILCGGRNGPPASSVFVRVHRTANAGVHLVGNTRPSRGDGPADPEASSVPGAAEVADGAPTDVISQSRTVLSALHAAPEANRMRVSLAHSQRVAADPPDASKAPSRLKSSDQTARRWPANRAISVPMFRSQILIAPLMSMCGITEHIHRNTSSFHRPPDASRLPLGVMHNALTGDVWPVIKSKARGQIYPSDW